MCKKQEISRKVVISHPLVHFCLLCVLSQRHSVYWQVCYEEYAKEDEANPNIMLPSYCTRCSNNVKFPAYELDHILYAGFESEKLLA